MTPVPSPIAHVTVTDSSPSTASGSNEVGAAAPRMARASYTRAEATRTSVQPYSIPAIGPSRTPDAAAIVAAFRLAASTAAARSRCRKPSGSAISNEILDRGPGRFVRDRVEHGPGVGGPRQLEPEAVHGRVALEEPLLPLGVPFLLAPDAEPRRLQGRARNPLRLESGADRLDLDRSPLDRVRVVHGPPLDLELEHGHLRIGPEPAAPLDADHCIGHV